MIRRLTVAVAVAAVTLMAGTAGTSFKQVEPGTRFFTVNNSVGQNHIKFVSDAPMEEIIGSAKGISGEFRLDPANLEATTGSFEVQVTSMKTAISKRDGHMYSSSWLDAEKFPTITFQVKSLKNVKVETHEGHRIAKGKATGTFTAHGVSKYLEADVVITFQPESDMTKKRAPGDLIMIDAKFDVALADYKVTGMGDIIGSKVGHIINIEAVLYANGRQSMTN